MQYKLFDIEDNKKSLFITKWDFNNYKWIKLSTHSCVLNSYEDWRIKKKSYLLKLELLIDIIKKQTPILIHHDKICWKSSKNPNRKKYINIHKNILNPKYENVNMLLPCVIVKTKLNPEKNEYRCIEGAYKLIKLQENNIFKSYFFIISEEDFLKFLMEFREQRVYSNTFGIDNEKNDKIILNGDIKYNTKDLNWLKFSTHTCMNLNLFNKITLNWDWRINNKNYIFYFEPILNKLITIKPKLIKYENICIKYSDITIPRNINANIYLPGIAVETNINPENKKYRCIDGVNRIIKLKNKNITESYFYIIKEELFLKYLFEIDIKNIKREKSIPYRERIIKNIKLLKNNFKFLNIEHFFYNYNSNFYNTKFEIKAIKHEKLIVQKDNSNNIIKNINEITKPLLVIKHNNEYKLLSKKEIINTLNDLNIFESYFCCITINLKSKFNFNILTRNDKKILNKKIYISLKNDKNDWRINKKSGMFYLKSIVPYLNILKPLIIDHKAIHWDKNNNIEKQLTNITGILLKYTNIKENTIYACLYGSTTIDKLERNNINKSKFIVLNKECLESGFFQIFKENINKEIVKSYKNRIELLKPKLNYLDELIKELKYKTYSLYSYPNKLNIFNQGEVITNKYFYLFFYKSIINNLYNLKKNIETINFSEIANSNLILNNYEKGFYLDSNIKIPPILLKIKDKQLCKKDYMLIHGYDKYYKFYKEGLNKMKFLILYDNEIYFKSLIKCYKKTIKIDLIKNNNIGIKEIKYINYDLKYLVLELIKDKKYLLLNDFENFELCKLFNNKNINCYVISLETYSNNIELFQDLI